MELFLQFVSYQWHLFGLLSLLLFLWIFYEQRKAGPQVTPQQLSYLMNREEAVVVDVRPSADFKKGHIVDALNIPYDQIENQAQQLEKHAGKPLVVVCKMGQHSSAAAKVLKSKGIEPIYRLNGGMMEWTNAQMPLVKGKG